MLGCSLLVLLSCNGAWHLATLKRFQLRLARLSGYWLPPAKGPRAVTKSVGPGLGSGLAWPGLARTEWPSKRCSRNYCNSHHLERILMAIEWPSNAATRCGNFAFLHMLLEPDQSQGRARPDQTSPAAQLNRLVSSARDAHVIAGGHEEEKGVRFIRLRELEARDQSVCFPQNLPHVPVVCGTCENCRNLTDRVKCSRLND